LERRGKTYQRVRAIFELYSANLNTPEFEAIELEMAPKFSEMSSTIYQNAALFARIAAVHNGKEMEKLTTRK
jgi:peptidyl-dipeptidase Dcp